MAYGAQTQATRTHWCARADRPTIYFIGVTTSRSSIMEVFPEWAEALGLKDSLIRGIDFPRHADPGAYRGAVRHIKSDELSLGAVVTTHKIDLLRASRDLFDELDPCAQAMGEVSCISKRHGKLVGHAKDPMTSGLALAAFLPVDHWEETGAEALVLGAGGSSIAIASHLPRTGHGDSRPSRIIATDRSGTRLAEMRRVHRKRNVDASRRPARAASIAG